MDQAFLLALCVCAGFISGSITGYRYGVRAMISEPRRREVRKAPEALRQPLDGPRKRSLNFCPSPPLSPKD
jgi:hypothetical protein